MFGNLYAAVTPWYNAICSLSTVSGAKLLEEPWGSPEWPVRGTSTSCSWSLCSWRDPQGMQADCQGSQPDPRAGTAGPGHRPGDDSSPPRQGTEPSVSKPGRRECPRRRAAHHEWHGGRSPALRPSVPGVSWRSTVTRWDGESSAPLSSGSRWGKSLNFWEGV